MPTDRANSNDRELSKLLGQAEPPRSPPHVDEAILAHAHRKAEEQRRRGNSSRRPWFGPHWTPALSVISVAAIAVAVSLQIFDEPPTEPRSASLESARSPAEFGSSGDEIDSDEQQAEPDSAETALTSAANVENVDNIESREQLATADASVEEVIVTGAFIQSERQSRAQRNLPAIPEAERSRFLARLALAVLADWRERDIDAETLSEAAREFELLRERVLADYARLSAQALAQAQQRYEALISDTELPVAGTLDQAILQLQGMAP